MKSKKKIFFLLIVLLISLLSRSQNCFGDSLTNSVYKDGEVIMCKQCEMIGCFCVSNWVVVRSEKMCIEQMEVLERAQVIQVQSRRFLLDTSLKLTNLQNLSIETKSEIDIVNDPRLRNLLSLYVKQIPQKNEILNFGSYVRLKNLTILDISKSNISVLPKSLCSLYIGGVTSLDSILLALKDVEDIKSLDIEFKNSQKFKIPANASLPSTIEEFGTNAGIDSASIGVIAEMKSLKKLTIHRLDLLEEDFAYLSNLSFIQTILLNSRGLSKAKMEKIRSILLESGHTVSFY